MLTPQSRPLLKGEVTLELREDARFKASTRKLRPSKTPLAEGDRPLFEALRQRRRELAERHNLPAYVILHDATLVQMAAAARPQTNTELLDINGVGQAKLDRYGRGVPRDHPRCLIAAGGPVRRRIAHASAMTGPPAHPV